jgi:hypothetical protein
VSKENMPINPSDYIRYRHAIKHPFVALSKEAATGNQIKRFYVFDSAANESKKFKNNTNKDAAMSKYLEIRNEAKQVDQMLTLLGVDPRDYASPDARTAKLREFAEGESEKFVKIFDDGDIEFRALIRGMVNTKVLKEIGKRYIAVESGKEIGASLEEAIYFLKDDDNSEEVVVLKALYQEAMTKPVVQQGKKTVV